MIIAWTDGHRRPAPRIVLWHQLVIGLAVFGVYLLVNALPVQSRRATADLNGHDLYRFEQFLSLDVERPVNLWLAEHETLATFANYEYAFTYVLSAIVIFVWIYLAHRERFARVRDSFILVNLVALTCFAFYPVTPPRLLPDLGFVDTVTRGRTWGSWGSSLVDHANQLAAMPSLHVAWALWVSAVLARLSARRWVQLLGALHVLVTVAVTVATANHYLVDALAAVPIVAGSVSLTDAWHDRRRRPGQKIASSDAFFLHVEDTGAAQHVGGLVVFDPADDDAPALATIQRVVEGELDRMPRFRQRAVTSRWRRPRWIDVDHLDWTWHLSERRSANGMVGLWRVVSELAESPLPRDRPLWRIVLVRDVAPGQTGFVIVVHHSVADGIGTVLHTLNLMRPRVGLPTGAAGAARGRARLALGTALGLAQLATDGTARGRPGVASPRRDFATSAVDLATYRRVASSYGARFTDLLLSLVAAAVASTLPDLAAGVRGRLRVAVPLMARSPDTGSEGNATAAVMVDLPVDGRPFTDLLSEVGRRTSRLRTPTRALGSRFVMVAGLRVLPEPWVGWFARTVYGRRFFHGVASNLPGPTQHLTMGGVGMQQVYPILPLAPGAPLALGALSWAGVLGFGVTTDPAVADARVVAARVAELFAELAAETTENAETKEHAEIDGTGQVAAAAPGRSSPDAAAGRIDDTPPVSELITSGERPHQSEE